MRAILPSRRYQRPNLSGKLVCYIARPSFYRLETLGRSLEKGALDNLKRL